MFLACIRHVSPPAIDRSKEGSLGYLSVQFSGSTSTLPSLLIMHSDRRWPTDVFRGAGDVPAPAEALYRNIRQITGPC
jgi:hypothetical protein